MKLKFAAHILCLPCCLVILNTLALYGWTAICERYELPESPGIMIVIPFLAYYFVPTTAGIIYVALCQASLGAVWFVVRPPWKSRIVFLVYNLVVLIFIGYDIWWYATGQVFQSRMGYL